MGIMPSLPPPEARRAFCFHLFTTLLCTTCFILSVFSSLSCDFVRRSTSLDPDVRYVLPLELEQRLAYSDLASFAGIGMGFWSYSVWGGGQEEGAEGACYPYHLCFLDGSYSVPPNNSGLGSARTFAVMSNIVGGVGTCFLWFAMFFHVHPAQFTRPVGSVLWMACLCQAWTLVLMTRSSARGPTYFSYCLPETYQDFEAMSNFECHLEQGGKMAIASTVMWFFCAIIMCIRPNFSSLMYATKNNARVGAQSTHSVGEMWDYENGSVHSRGRPSSRRSSRAPGTAADRRRRSRSNESALARFAAAAEAADREEQEAIMTRRRSRSSESALARFAAAAEADNEEEGGQQAVGGGSSQSRGRSTKDQREKRRRSRSNDKALERLAQAAEMEDLENGGKNGYGRKSSIGDKSWGV